MPPSFRLPFSNTTHPTEPTVCAKANPHTDTFISFDWDDTLLCSSFLNARGIGLNSDPAKVREFEPQLTELSHTIIHVLSLALQYGPVTIITNAETGWVQLSCEKFIPLVLPMLSKVTILSARSTYESLFPDSPFKWKFYAFQERITCMSVPGSKKEKNVLSFGDSHVEREAVRACTRGMPHTRTKSVKFAERPSSEQLRRQLELVGNCFQYITNHDGDLDLQLTVTVNGSANNNPSTSTTQTTSASTNHQQKSSDGTESKAMYGNLLAQHQQQATAVSHNNPLTTSEEKPH